MTKLDGNGSATTITAPTASGIYYLYSVNSGGASVQSSHALSVTAAALNSVQVGSVTESGSYDYTWTVTVTDQYGNPITGLNYTDFAVEDTTTSMQFNGVSSTLNNGNFTVTGTGVPGQYTVEAQSASQLSTTPDQVSVSVLLSGVTKTGTNAF